MVKSLSIGVASSLLMGAVLAQEVVREKYEDIGLEIESAAEPEKLVGGDEYLIQTIEIKTGGEIEKGKPPGEPLNPMVQDAVEEEVAKEAEGSRRKKAKKKRGRERRGRGRVHITEDGVVEELVRKRQQEEERKKQLIKLLTRSNPQVLQNLSRRFAMPVKPSEAEDWLKEEGGAEAQGRGQFQYTPEAQRREGEPAYYRKADERRAREQQREKREKTLFGYCIVDRDINVTSLQMKARFPCVFNDPVISSGFVWGTLEPKPRAYSLLFKPERIETDVGVFQVREGIALNGNRSSNNIASVVDTRAIEKIFAKAGVDTAQSSKRMVEEAWKNDGTTIFTTGTVTVQKKEFNLNLLPFYAMWTAGLSLAEGLMDLLQEEAKNIPVLFSIHRGARIYVEVVIDAEPYLR